MTYYLGQYTLKNMEFQVLDDENRVVARAELELPEVYPPLEVGDRSDIQVRINWVREEEE